jgi:hypothetical protein
MNMYNLIKAALVAKVSADLKIVSPKALVDLFGSNFKVNNFRQWPDRC